MPEQPKQRRKRTMKRIPKLKHTNYRNIGWYVSYRDSKTKTPTKHPFGNITREEALKEYQLWLSAHLSGQTPPVAKKIAPLPDPTDPSSFTTTESVPGCLLLVASSLITYDEERTRKTGEPRRSGTISADHFDVRKASTRKFLKFLNDRYGTNAVHRMNLADLTMHDVEAFNRSLVKEGMSARHIAKRMSVVKDIIDRAGRPEHDTQTLTWNWESRDILRGKPPKERPLLTLTQLKRILLCSGPREQAIVWMGIGLGFGQSDISVTRVGQIDKKGYDLRRGKTQIERYGDTPPMVWAAITKYLKQTPRPAGELLFLTKLGNPLVHGKRSDAVILWWSRLRKQLNETKESMSSFYILRHIGATEYGSRDKCSIGMMRRWLGHSASSDIADVYMRDAPPEHRELIEWVRKSLLSGKADLTEEDSN